LDFVLRVYGIIYILIILNNKKIDFYCSLIWVYIKYNNECISFLSSWL
jgi:hypothetical protein